MKFISTIWDYFLKKMVPARSFLGKLVEPSEKVTDISMRDKARLSASMALVIFVFNIIGILSSVGISDITSIFSLVGLAIFLLGAYVLSRSRLYRLGASLLVLALSALAFIPLIIRPNIAQTEISNSIYSFLPISLVIASSILGLWEMFLGAIVQMLIISSIPAVYPVYTFAQSGTDAGNIVTIGFLLLIVVAYRNTTEKERINQIERFNAELQTANQEISQARETLEIRIHERTADLEQRSQELAHQSKELEKANAYNERRAIQFEAVSGISRSIAEINKLDELLPIIVQIISEKLGYYHTGIFLVDDASQYAMLAAANSQGGQQMIDRGHRLEVGKEGIVGNVAATRMPRIALDTGDDAVYFKNPDLPDTHSEIALPLMTGNKVIGVLDVQSTISNAFNQDDVIVLSALAAQVSIAIRNARLFETSQKSLADAEALYRQFIQKEWTKVGKKQAVTGFRYNTLGIAAIEGADSASVERIASQKVHIDTSNETSTLAVPITLRGEVIGILDVQTAGTRSWDQDDIDIAQAIADRVAISAENARLFEQTTERAERERAVSDITSKIRSTNDPNEMIQIALNELKQVLKVKDARVVPYNPQKNGEVKE